MATRTPVEELEAHQPGRKRLVRWVVFGLLVLASAMVGALGGLLLVYTTDLPEIGELEHYRPSSVTELYDDQGRVIGSFALQRRVVASYDDFPKVLREAIISIEDKDFEKHWGINLWRGIGAAYRDMTSGTRAQGASTLTMQLARNLFLSPERTFNRKVQEILLSIQIERRFTKPQIFTLYANQIFLGHGVYGFEAGAQYYFSKRARDLTLDEAALLAGLPKAPNAYSPINNPDRTLRRRNLVINSMLEDGKITASEAARAKNSPLRLHLQADPNFLAPYFVEEIRRYLEKKYGSDEVHQGGLRVYTSLNSELQAAANQAVLDGVAAYERRHGWKGKLENAIAEGMELDKFDHPDWGKPIQAGSYVHALVNYVSPALANLKFGKYSSEIAPPGIAWTGHKRVDEILAKGDVVYVKVSSISPDSSAQVTLEQDSGAQGALLAIDNATGDVKAMVGGRDFDLSKFNRATQAQRQVGSSFKPYVYTAAIDEVGMTPDDVVVDAPVTFETASGPYIPHNYDGKFEGAITLRRALAQSRNIPALKVADRVGIKTVIEYAHKFGITSPIPPYLPVALGSADLTLMEQTSAFTTFPGDGVRVVPRYIRKVEDYSGRTLEEGYPEVHDVVSSRTARILTGMLREVVLHGTAYSASKLNHPLAGKTGTTNDFTDAWFIGFSPSITCGVWVGFDEKKSLGNRETGALAALPIWMEFMKIALRGRDQEQFPEPPVLPPKSLAQQLDTPDFHPGDGETH
ncbi:MAG TPA: PBP1A family penicillin-binding protein [Terriglobales bacterium]|nr:PBP1A family penicillin-binding protein [Terriglobales bacterium]